MPSLGYCEQDSSKHGSAYIYLFDILSSVSLCLSAKELAKSYIYTLPSHVEWLK